VASIERQTQLGGDVTSTPNERQTARAWLTDEATSVFTYTHEQRRQARQNGRLERALGDLTPRSMRASTEAASCCSTLQIKHSTTI